MPRENFSGITLNREYRLRQSIGQGTSAAVYLSQDLRSNTLVAVKLFDSHVEPMDIRREAQTQGRLHHPNIVPFHWMDTAEIDGMPHPFIVMKHANKGSLRERIQSRPLSTGEAVDYLVQSSTGIQYAHEQKILHRDLKPANLLLTQQQGDEHPIVMVSDFGIAVRAHVGDSDFTSQIPMGTAAYIAPEQIQGKAVIASDIYSLGVISFELFTGQTPFIAESDGGYLAAQLIDPPPTFEDVLGSNINPVTGALEGIVMSTLSKDPKERPGSAGDFAEGLREAYEQASRRQLRHGAIIDLYSTRVDERAVTERIHPDQVVALARRDEGAEIIRNGPYAQEGDYVRSAGLFESVAGNFADDPWFQFDYGVVLTRVGGEYNVARGIDLLEWAVELQRAKDEPVSEWMHIGLAEAYGRADRYDDARREYQHAFEINPHNELLNALYSEDREPIDRAWRLHDDAKKDFEEGRNLQSLLKYEKAIILVGEEGIAWSVHDKGKVLQAQGHVKEAITELDKASKLIPDNTWTHSNYAMALEQVGSEHALSIAKTEYRRAFEIDNNNQDAQEGLERVEQNLAQSRSILIRSKAAQWVRRLLSPRMR